VSRCDCRAPLAGVGTTFQADGRAQPQRNAPDYAKGCCAALASRHPSPMLARGYRRMAAGVHSTGERQAVPVAADVATTPVNSQHSASAIPTLCPASTHHRGALRRRICVDIHFCRCDNNPGRGCSVGSPANDWVAEPHRSRSRLHLQQCPAPLTPMPGRPTNVICESAAAPCPYRFLPQAFLV